MTLTERVDKQIVEIDAAIQRIQVKAAAEVAALEKRRSALLSARSQVTPELERAVAGLEAVGIVPLP
jgi:hypothetical protein